MINMAVKGKEGERNFIWTDDETSLLLQVVMDFKAQKSSQGLDWEAVKSRYEDITERFIANYPKNEDSGLPCEAFPNKNNTGVFTKERILRKIKRIKNSYRKAVDNGRKSGCGKVVATFYDECSQIWSGSPAVESIVGGVESSSLENESLLDASQPSGSSSSGSVPDLVGHQDASDSEADEGGGTSSALERVKRMSERHTEFAKFLKEKRHAKLGKRDSLEVKLLDSAKEEVALKKRALEIMEDSGKKHELTMKTFSESISAMTNVISSGFLMMQGFMQQPLQLPYQHPKGAHQYYRGGINEHKEEKGQGQYMSYLKDDNQF